MELPTLSDRKVVEFSDCSRTGIYANVIFELGSIFAVPPGNTRFWFVSAFSTSCRRKAFGLK